LFCRGTMALTYMPTKIRCGETVEFSSTFGDYPATDYTLVYCLQNSSYQYSVSGTADGDSYDITIPKATTAGWEVGEYVYTGIVDDGTDMFVVESGTVEVIAAVSSAADRRSFAKRMLDAIEDLLENRATADVQSYTIAGRSLAKMPVSELLVLRDRFRAEYEQERRKERLDRGDGVSTSIKVRFA
jgi:hypothetical protein